MPAAPFCCLEFAVFRDTVHRMDTVVSGSTLIARDEGLPGRSTLLWEAGWASMY